MVGNDLFDSVSVNVVVQTFKSVDNVPKGDVAEEVQLDDIQHPLDDVMRWLVCGLLRLSGRLTGCILLWTGLGVVSAHNPHVRLVGPFVVNFQVFVARNEIL